MEGDDTRKILSEIRDLQREHLAEYRKVSEEVLNLQRDAVTRQALFGSAYRRIVAVGGIMALALTVLLIYLLAKWWGPLFGH